MGWRRWWRSIQRRVRPGRGRRKHEVNCQEEARSCQAKEYQKTQRGCCQRKEQRLLALLLPESESKENGDGDRCPGRRGHLQLHGHARPEILHRLLIESICNIEICILQFNCILVILSTCIKNFSISNKSNAQFSFNSYVKLFFISSVPLGCYYAIAESKFFDWNPIRGPRLICCIKLWSGFYGSYSPFLLLLLLRLSLYILLSK